MRPSPRSVILASLVGGLSVGGCQAETFELLVSPRPVPELVAAEIAELSRELPDLDDVDVEVRVGGGALANLEEVASGRADLGIVPNSVEFRPGVRTVAVLYTGVLHTIHRRPGEPRNFVELVDGAKVYAGPEASVERWLLEILVERFGLAPDDFSLVDSLTAADVAIAFAPILPELPAELGPEWRFYSMADPEQLGRGTPIEALPLVYPQLRPFVIPARTYPRLDHPAVVTTSVDMLLVAREGLDEDLVRALTRALVEHRRQLAEGNPALFAGIRAEPDGASATFALHEGARQYFERDQPSLAERYAELAGVLFSVFFASVTGLLGVSRWRDHRRKDRIDVYYAEVWRVRSRIGELDAGEIEAAIAQLRALEARAFEALIAEQLAADEAFRIFVTLMNDTVRDLRSEQR